MMMTVRTAVARPPPPPRADVHEQVCADDALVVASEQNAAAEIVHVLKVVS